MSKPSSPRDNAMAENFFSIFKTECLYLEKPETLDEALALTDEFLHYYNYKRIQGNGLTPYEERQMAFKKQKNRQQLGRQPQTPRVYPLLGIIGKCKGGKPHLLTAIYRITPRLALGRSPPLPSLAALKSFP